jgi:hypothetical protein
VGAKQVSAMVWPETGEKGKGGTWGTWEPWGTWATWGTLRPWAGDVRKDTRFLSAAHAGSGPWAYLVVMCLACVYGRICQVNPGSYTLVYTLSW